MFADVMIRSSGRFRTEFIRFTRISLSAVKSSLNTRSDFGVRRFMPLYYLIISEFATEKIEKAKRDQTALPFIRSTEVTDLIYIRDYFIGNL